MEWKRRMGLTITINDGIFEIFICLSIISLTFIESRFAQATIIFIDDRNSAECRNGIQLHSNNHISDDIVPTKFDITVFEPREMGTKNVLITKYLIFTVHGKCINWIGSRYPIYLSGFNSGEFWLMF